MTPSLAVDIFASQCRASFGKWEAGQVRVRIAIAALLSAALLIPVGASAQVEYPTRLIDIETAYTLPRAAYSMGARVVPDGGLVGGMSIGVTPYLMVGVSYGARNVVGSGEPDWDDRVEFEVKLRLAEEYGIVPALAFGFNSRGYGSQIDGGGYERVSQGFYVAAAKTLPFSEYWQAHFGLSRTLDLEKTDPDLHIGLTARFSQEFSVVAEYQIGMGRSGDDPRSSTGYLNLGLRWVFGGQLQLEMLFRNIVGPSDSAELNSRSIGFVFYDSF